jgi:hypothetical protein
VHVIFSMIWSIRCKTWANQKLFDWPCGWRDLVTRSRQ